MKLSILVCTFGDDYWRRLAAQRAMPSAIFQGAEEVKQWHGPDLTLAEVRNAAAREAVGDVLCFLDADDELGPGFVTAMREAAAQSFPALLYPSVQYVHPDGREEKPRLLGKGRPLVELNRAVIGSLVPRALFNHLGGFKELDALEDWELWLRVSRHVPLVPVPEAVYRVHLAEQGRNVDQSLYWSIRREHEALTP